jgi:hypothetical protein
MLVLVGVNAFLLFFSVNNNTKRIQKNRAEISEITSSNVYPLNILETNLKKAV